MIPRKDVDEDWLGMTWPKIETWPDYQVRHDISYYSPFENALKNVSSNGINLLCSLRELEMGAKNDSGSIDNWKNNH